MGITKVAPKLTKIATRLGKDGTVESEQIIHADGRVEIPGQAVPQVLTEQDIEIERLKKEIEIAELKKKLEALKQ